MTLLQSHRILVGATGWLHENWQGNFYPEDLPEDWYLGYYGNEFPVVQVTEKEMQQGAEVEDWLEETDELPVFIIDIPLQHCNDGLLEQAQPYLQVVSKMAQRCVGIVCQVNNSVSNEALRELLQACQAVAPTILSMANKAQHLQQMLNELKVNLLWETTGDNEDHGGSLFVARVDTAQTSLPELRTIMENLQAREAANTTLVLLLGGENPDIEVIKQAKVMLDLL